MTEAEAAVIVAAREWNRVRLESETNLDMDFQLVVDACSKLGEAVDSLERTLAQ